MREALRNVICPTCGGPPVTDDYFDEQKLRMDNARLKEEASRFAFSSHCAPSPFFFIVLSFSHGDDVARAFHVMGSLTGCPA